MSRAPSLLLGLALYCALACAVVLPWRTYVAAVEWGHQAFALNRAQRRAMYRGAR